MVDPTQKSKQDADRAEASAARKDEEQDPSEHNAGGQGISG